MQKLVEDASVVSPSAAIGAVRQCTHIELRVLFSEARFEGMLAAACPLTMSTVQGRVFGLDNLAIELADHESGERTEMEVVEAQRMRTNSKAAGLR